MDPTNDPRSFFSALFDLSFSRFITPKIIRVLFLLGIVGIGVGYLGAVISAFSIHVATGLVVLFILGPLMAIVYVVFLRVWLELVIVAFRIMENTREMAQGPASRSSSRSH